MILSVIILGTSITLTLFQFLKQSMLGWQVAKWLSVALFFASVYNVYEQNKDREFYIGSLEQIGTRINWEDTGVSVDLLNDPESVPARSVSVQMKLLSPTEVRLANSSNNLGIIRRSCVSDAQDDIGYMSEQEAKTLFNAFVRSDGSISFGEEKAAGIEHLLYSGKETIAAPVGNARVRMSLDLAPNAQSQFSSLSGLNGAIVIGLIQGGAMKSPLFSSLSIQLVTAMGVTRIELPMRVVDQENLHTISGARYVGLCIPKEYFDVVKHKI